MIFTIKNLELLLIAIWVIIALGYLITDFYKNNVDN